MSTPMRLAAAGLLLVEVLAETVHVNLVPWCDAPAPRVALFLAAGFVITELAAGWHVMVNGFHQFLAGGRSIRPVA